MWGSLLLRGLFLALLGLAILLWPDTSIAFLVRIVGVFCVIDGVTTLLRADRFKPSARPWTQGAVIVGLGVMLLFWPDISSRIVVMLFGVWLTYTGLSQLLYSRNFEARGRPMLRGAGLVSIIAGIVLLVWPVAGMVTIAWLIALPALIIGALFVAMGLRFRP